MNKWLRKLRFYWWRFTYALRERTPTFCPMCGHWVGYRDTSMVRATTGHDVRLCNNCKKNLYEPWS